ncbi:MAG: STAS domain-containing protein, partial [Bacteroidota bacterium]
LNSTAIGILVNILTKCRRSGGEATLLGVSEKNKDILNIVKLNSIFTITDDLPSAIRDFRSGM